MEKLKRLLSNISKSMKEVFKKFPITISIVYIITLVCVFGTDEFLDTFFDDAWFLLLVLTGMGTLFVETYFSKKTIKIIGTCISLGIAGVYRNLMLSETEIDEFLEKIYMTYVLVLPILTLYKMVKKSNLELHEYGLNVISNLGRCSIIYLLANLGIALVLFVFIELILDGKDFDIVEKTLVLLLGGYYIPSLINAFTDMTQEPGKFIKVLISYVCTPVVTFLLGILYLYILKITVNGELLKNSIFFILSLTFCTVIPVSLLLRNYNDKVFINKLSKVLMYLFIPFILLQLIAMGIRVNDYGLTSSRYMAYILVVFEIIFISLMIFKNSKYLTESLLFAVGLTVFLILGPLNYIKVPVMSQTARIEKILSKENSFDALDVKDKNECKSAYAFLLRNDGKEYLEKKIDKETLSQIDEYVPVRIEDDDTGNYEEYLYVSVYDNLDELDISNYSKIYEVSSNGYYWNEELDYSNYEIESRNNKRVIYADVEDLIQNMITAEMNGNEKTVFEKYRLLETKNENVDMYITNIYIRYELYSKDIEAFEISGYILEK